MQYYLPKPTRHVVPSVNEGPQRVPVPRQPPPIAGKAFAILDNGWDVMDELTAALTERLEHLGASEVLRIPVFVGGPVEPDFLDEIAAKVAGAVCGLGN